MSEPKLGGAKELLAKKIEAGSKKLGSVKKGLGKIGGKAKELGEKGLGKLAQLDKEARALGYGRSFAREGMDIDTSKGALDELPTTKGKTDAEKTKLGETVAARLLAEREEDRLKIEKRNKEVAEEEAIQEDALRFKESDHEEAIQDDKDWEEAQANATEGKIGAEKTKETPPTPEEEKEIKKELDTLPEKEKSGIATGLNNIGFKVEQKKNNFFANAFDFISKKVGEEGSPISSWAKSMRDSFTRDAKAAEQKAEDAASGKKSRKLSNVGLLVGNITKYGRIISDFTTHSLVSPLRYVMMVGAFGARSADAAKEARLSNEEVIDKTRVKDIDKAAEEAWQIYRNAMAESDNQEVLAAGLKKAYIDRLPKDLMERMSRDSGMGFWTVQGFIKADLGGAIKRLNKKIEEIEGDSKLSPEQKEQKRQMLLREQERNLMDYDRILTQYGTVDELAMAGRYAKAAGNAVVWATTVETIALSVEKLWSNLSNMLAHEDSQKAGATVAKIIEHKDTTTHIAQPSDTTHIAKPDSVANTDTTQVLQTGDSTHVAKPDTGSLKISPDSTKVVGDTTKIVTGVDTTAASAVAGAGKSGIEAVAGAKPEVVIAGHEWTHPMEFKVAGPLEHAYEKLVLDHTMPGGDLSQDGIVLNQTDATRALNEAANLVRLTEGHATAGISLERFNSAFSYDAVTKVLKIIDPKGAQSIIDDLHTHSGGINLSGAEKFVGNVDWHDKVQALDMHEVEPGVGHPEVTDNQIGEMPKPFHPVDAVREEVLSKYDQFLNRPPISDTLENPQNINWLDNSETAQASTANNILDPNDPMFQEHMAPALEGSKIVPEGPRDPLGDVYNDMTRIWTPDDAETAFNYNIHNLFPPPKGLSLLYNNNWILIKNSLATDVLNTGAEANDAVLGPIVPYLNKLQEVTGLKPHGASWLRSGETVSKYILRATQKAAEMGTEAMQKIRVK